MIGLRAVGPLGKSTHSPGVYAVQCTYDGTVAPGDDAPLAGPSSAARTTSGRGPARGASFFYAFPRAAAPICQEAPVSNGHIYISTTIPYVNARPHLGHALELVQADVLA